MKKGYKLILIIIGALLIGIIAGVSATLLLNKDNGNEVTGPKYPTGEGGENPNPEADAWEEELDLKAFKLFDQIYGKDYVFELNENGEWTTTFKELQDKFEFDTTDFVNEKVSCNLETSTITVYVYEGENVVSTDLDCKQLTTENEKR